MFLKINAIRLAGFNYHRDANIIHTLHWFFITALSGVSHSRHCDFVDFWCTLQKRLLSCRKGIYLIDQILSVCRYSRTPIVINLRLCYYLLLFLHFIPRRDSLVCCWLYITCPLWRCICDKNFIQSPLLNTRWWRLYRVYWYFILSIKIRY